MGGASFAGRRGVVIGSFRVLSMSGLDTSTVTVTVAIESNYTEVTGGAQKSWYANERWTLERRRDILSPPPEKAMIELGGRASRGPRPFYVVAPVQTDKTNEAIVEVAKELRGVAGELPFRAEPDQPVTDWGSNLKAEATRFRKR